jgi:protein-L-isoaspartate(D-aspartate) O-methyltransferase
VTSLDIDPEPADRARDLLRQHGNSWVSVVCADGRGGWPPAAPYQRLVAWACSSGTIPDAWARQVLPGGVIVAPIRRGTTEVVAALQVEDDGALQQTGEIPGGFIPLTSEPFRPWESG